jgi:hypothetical protein
MGVAVVTALYLCAVVIVGLVATGVVCIGWATYEMLWLDGLQEPTKAVPKLRSAIAEQQQQK